MSWQDKLQNPTTWIKAMGMVGALMVGFVLIRAGSAPKFGEENVGRLGRDVAGYEVALPPRPIPTMPLHGPEGVLTLPSLPNRVLVVLFATNTCVDCTTIAETFATAQSALGEQNVRFIVVDAEAHDDVLVLRDTTNAYHRYLPAGRRDPIVVVYRNGRDEIGRITGVEAWLDGSAERFIAAL